MEYIIISLAAFLTSGLTLFSGFGLGTLLMPVFAIFFPIHIAVGMTALVHFANNIFKLALVGREADISTVIRFGLPAILAAFVGAFLLQWLSDLQPLFGYSLFGNNFQIMPVKLIIAILMLCFALFELLPHFEKLSFPKKYLPIGGVLSGFFGGLSGHQGALRSAFLIKTGMSKESFIGTGVVIACLIDATRLSVYSGHFAVAGIADNSILLACATLAAFLGAFIGNRLIKKITLSIVKIIVAIMLFVIALGLGTGLI
ncbi:MAG: sulfite exporter TauE/SafE family protein [Bacteroidota bacterium]|nr:sulfite exporter TauE/SafE family protein [Bacteroidota bacterium]